MAMASVESGEVTYTRGDAWLVRDGGRIALSLGMKVHEGDVVVTRDSGRIKLKMVDDSRLFVGRQSRLTIEDYRMQGSNLLSGKFNMLWGKVRFLVSKLRIKSSSFEVATKTAVIGVRGTEFAVVVQAPEHLSKRPAIHVRKDVARDLRPTKLLLFSGAVVGKSLSGFQKNIKPGMAANFHPSGFIESRRINRADMQLVDDLPSPKAPVNAVAPGKQRVDELPARTSQGIKQPESGVEQSRTAQLGLRQNSRLNMPTDITPTNKSRVVVPSRLLPKASQPNVVKPAVRTPIDRVPNRVTIPASKGARLRAPNVTKPTPPVAPKPTLRPVTPLKPTVGRPNGVRAPTVKPLAPKPVVSKPTVQRPVALKPVVSKPTVQRPVALKPVVSKPTVQRPVAPKPVVSKPTVQRPVALKPVVSKPTVQRPVAPKPVVSKPVVSKPVVSKPVVSKPVVSKPVVSKPVVSKPVVSRPIVAKPIINRPVKPLF